ncbi:MAG: hypothetical protein JXK05_09150 [Campylobacterales bacterium]|nr:hypothetical protein [Campylobacterales bacterium]
MVDVLEPLKRLDPETISSRTKISPANIKRLLNREFESFSKVQFFGFISILEREYGIDLYLLKEDYAAFDAARHPRLQEREYVLGTPRERRSGRWWLGVLMLALLAWTIYTLLPVRSSEQATTVEYAAISKAKERLEAAHQQALSEANLSSSSESAGLLMSSIAITAQETFASSVAASSAAGTAELILMPARRLWLGLIDADSGQKMQQIIESPFEINTSKRWRGILGHGYVEVRVNGVAQSYRTPDKLWFVYDNGTFEIVDSTVFLQLNGGKAW